MTEIGSDVKVDGTVTARQASKAGEAVVLGSDGLIPADLLPKTSGGGVPYFYVDESKRTVDSFTYDDTKTDNTSYNVVRDWTFGNVIYAGTTKRVDPVVIPGIGPVAMKATKLTEPTSGTSHNDYRHQLDKAHTEMLLTDCIRTNLRGRFTLNVQISSGTSLIFIKNRFNEKNESNIVVDITDSGISVVSGQYTTYYFAQRSSLDNISLRVTDITCDLPAWC